MSAFVVCVCRLLMPGLSFLLCCSGPGPGQPQTHGEANDPVSQVRGAMQGGGAEGAVQALSYQVLHL